MLTYHGRILEGGVRLMRGLRLVLGLISVQALLGQEIPSPRTPARTTRRTGGRCDRPGCGGALWEDKDGDVVCMQCGLPPIGGSGRRR